MITKPSKQIDARIFVGIELTFEIQKKLNESHAWKDAKIADPNALKEIQYQEKKYLGSLLPYNEVTIKDLENESKKVLAKISSFCPFIKLEKNSTIVFPQVFVA
jgi:hypothetical protein